MGANRVHSMSAVLFVTPAQLPGGLVPLVDRGL